MYLLHNIEFKKIEAQQFDFSIEAEAGFIWAVATNWVFLFQEKPNKFLKHWLYRLVIRKYVSPLLLIKEYNC